MPGLNKAVAGAMIILLLVASCGETEQESVYVSPTATLRPPTGTPPLPSAIATNTSSPPPAATATNTPTPVPSQTSTPVPTETRAATPTLAPPAIPFPGQPPELGDTLTRPVDGMVMVYVPGGTFEMGSLPDDKQFGPHAVTQDGFWIDQVEVTNAQFAAFLNDQGNQVEDG